MPKILKAIIVGGYCALIIYLLRSEFFDSTLEIELNYLLRTPRTVKRLMKEIKNMKKNSTINMLPFKRPKRLPGDYKYFLKWTQAFSHFELPIFRQGQKPFIDFNCTYQNCYITNDKSVLIDIRHFDAIIIDVENTWDTYNFGQIPHQTYVFFAKDSAINDPVCYESFDNFFHLTWTYKLDSNISSPFITIEDKNKNIIGPKQNMTWIKSMEPPSEDVIAKLKNKKKAVAWYVFDCHSIGRMSVVKNLTDSLKNNNLNLDIYGSCGNFTCPKDRIEDCFSLFQKKYYFYLAFENSVSEDYVTDIILYPLLHYTVPIVFGGADYSRFLPPGSYIDAGKLKSDEVVDLMVKAMETPSVYHDYFRWRQHYMYKESPKGADVCKLCEVLNSPNFPRLNNFRRWWNYNYENVCKIPFIKNSQFKF